MKINVIICLLIAVSLNISYAQIAADSKAIKPGQSLKTVLGDYEKGLDAVLNLNPKIYKYNGKGGMNETKTERVGLLVEEYAKVAPGSVKNYSYSKNGRSGKTSEAFSIEDPTEIIYMLINAVKEQQAVIDDFKNKFETLSNEKKAIDHVFYQNVSLNGEQEQALLAQNIPNPFSNNTKIEYFIPSKAETASIAFVDLNGKEIKRVKIEHSGYGTLNVSLDLPTGIYSYTLIVNGKAVDTKEMLLKN